MGEIVVLDQRGVSSFGGLQGALFEGRADRLLYYGIDLLHLDGQDCKACRWSSVRRCSR